ncbi:ribonuclease HII [Candidatus Woesebacteria bacterium]|nr:ribonuclease HII [Candidatus Woesebacteria bacterium]
MAEQYGDIEKKLLLRKKIIVGVDEVGRGALAGPVHAGAVILDFKKLFALDPQSLSLIRDSKSLSRSQREKSVCIVKDIASSYATGEASSQEIEEFGIVPATFLAMRRALKQLNAPFNLLIIDGKHPIPDFPHQQISIIGGDRTCYTIAAASILAKETRDPLMREHSLKYPGYGFDSHVGYATRTHLLAIKKLGICSLHRKNFAPLKNLT